MRRVRDFLLLFDTIDKSDGDVEKREKEKQLRSQSLEPKRRPHTDKDRQSISYGVGATTIATTYYPIRPLQEGTILKVRVQCRAA